MNTNREPRTLRDWAAFKAGRLKLRTWSVDPATGTRTMAHKDIAQTRREQAEAFKAIRARQLGLSQSRLAKAIHVSTRTLQGWEIGRSVAPEPVMVLLQLMRDMPAVRRRLVSA